jgi:hypothetical protein
MESDVLLCVDVLMKAFKGMRKTKNRSVAETTPEAWPKPKTKNQKHSPQKTTP